MKNRRERLEALKIILSTCDVPSQESLLPILKNHGYNVTQATLSRDLKALKVNKISNPDGGYALTLPNDTQVRNVSHASDFLRGYISIAVSQNIAVIRTHSGFTDVVATALDILLPEVVLGTIAGADNCVFACLRSGITEDEFFETAERKIHGFKRNERH